jgi:hypothetical protein
LLADQYFTFSFHCNFIAFRNIVECFGKGFGNQELFIVAFALFLDTGRSVQNIAMKCDFALQCPNFRYHDFSFIDRSRKVWHHSKLFQEMIGMAG